MKQRKYLRILFQASLFTALIFPTYDPYESLNDVLYSSTRPLRYHTIQVIRDHKGNSMEVPIAIIKGNIDGPIFTMVSGVHGYEYPPILAAQQLMKDVDTSKLKGTLLILPIANEASFYTRTPFINPKDKKNLNNVFPGNPVGTVTERIAHFISSQIVPVSDVFLDIHGGDSCEDLLPFIAYFENPEQPKQTALAKKLSERSGFQRVVSVHNNSMHKEHAKYAFKQAGKQKRTALSIKCGELNNGPEENASLIIDAIYNMLATMNMHRGSSRRHRDIAYYNKTYYVEANARGIFYSSHQAGDIVKKGDFLGYTSDVFGKIKEEYIAKFSGIVLYKLGTPPVNVGDTVMCIAG